MYRTEGKTSLLLRHLRIVMLTERVGDSKRPRKVVTVFGSVIRIRSI